MKTKTKWITAAAATLALTASLAIAAPGEGHGGFGRDGQGRHEQGAKMAEKLNLSDAQKAQWKAIQQSFRQENSAFFQQ
ncbi:MAG: hypothetical protein JWO56_833, partial [Acidobacteria bacterium]|nr:hypothetical protein [Acidobacteriota bacterium]